jgi:hypothetical protein
MSRTDGRSQQLATHLPCVRLIVGFMILSLKHIMFGNCSVMDLLAKHEDEP